MQIANIRGPGHLNYKPTATNQTNPSTSKKPTGAAQPPGRRPGAGGHTAAPPAGARGGEEGAGAPRPGGAEECPGGEPPGEQQIPLLSGAPLQVPLYLCAP